MLKQYFSDGLLQIAILLSLLRTDLINFSVPNNELLSYPEVQDILQGQTMAYVSTNFHNNYNSLSSLHGYSHPKHVESDFYFSSLFRELRRFRSGVTQNIEAFLVSSDGSVILLPQQANGGQSPTSTDVQTQVQVDSTTHAQLQADHADDEHHDIALQNAGFSAVYQYPAICGDVNTNPFPGCSLSEEDLELIEVLWRQDVDLGVGKEVFDPNLRRELEQERVLEIHKEQEKRKLAEKSERELRQQNEQWLLENFIRDGETGELIPIGGNSNSNYSLSGPSTYDSEATSQQAPVLADSYNLDGGYHINHSYGQQQQQQTFAPLLPDSLLILGNETEQQQFNYTQDGVPSQEEWDELVGYLNGTFSEPNTTTTTAPASFINSNISLLAFDSEAPMTSATTSIMSEPQLLYSQPPQQLDEFFTLDHNQTSRLLSPVSINESLHLLSSNRSGSQSAMLAELLNEAEMLLNNATLPLVVAPDSATPLTGMVAPPLANEYDALTQNLDSTTPAVADGDLTSDEWTQDIYPHLLDLANLTDNIDLNDSLPVLSSDVIANFGLLEDTGAGSDSAISVGSGSPLQDVNSTVDMSPMDGLTTMDISPFDGLEGATGGSDFDSATYGQQRSNSAGGSEDDGYHYSCSSYGSPASVNTNYSTGSNDTDHSSGRSSATMDFVHHNHTYPTLPGNTPREVKKYSKKEGSRMKGPQSKDMKRATELKIPYTIDQIIDAPVEEFNGMLTKSKLNEAQLNLMRDIRRRGKNKVAAQNCRKRKMEVITDLSGEKNEMRNLHTQLSTKRQQMEMEMKQAKEMYSLMYKEIFASLRDEDGHPYDPKEYSLQHGADGNVFLVRLSKQTATATLPIHATSNANQHRRAGPGGSSKRKDLPELPKKKRE